MLANAVAQQLVGAGTVEDAAVSNIGVTTGIFAVHVLPTSPQGTHRALAHGRVQRGPMMRLLRARRAAACVTTAVTRTSMESSWPHAAYLLLLLLLSHRGIDVRGPSGKAQFTACSALPSLRWS